MLLALLTTAGAVVACRDGSSGTSAGSVSGQQLAVDAGCAGCHGSGFDGALGPSWVDLYGSMVNLADGTRVIADRAYLFESIRDPGSELTAGFTVAMPANRLTDAEITAIVDYIVSLSDTTIPPHGTAPSTP